MIKRILKGILSWNFDVEKKKTKFRLVWTSSNHMNVNSDVTVKIVTFRENADWPRPSGGDGGGGEADFEFSI